MIAVVIAPFATATTGEQAAIRRVQTALIRTGRVPVFFPDVLTPLLNDGDQEEREVALRASEEFVRFVAAGGGEAHMVGDRITEGMKRDVAAWQAVTNKSISRHRL